MGTAITVAMAMAAMISAILMAMTSALARARDSNLVSNVPNRL
jgi:ABC-type arginine transport system permease subunit